MVFSSHLFVFYFLPCVLIVYFAVPARYRNPVLTAASYVFYGWGNPLFVLLMLASTLIDYASGLVMSWQPGLSPHEPIPLLEPGAARSFRQKSALWVSVVSNLAILGFFKYWNFGVDAMHDLLLRLGYADPAGDAVLRVVLPLGISFYTFQSMSYAIDVYRGEARAIRSLPDFACFVAMFPQLVAGPIIRFQELADQLQSRLHSRDRFARGVTFFGIGMAKKVLVANACGKVADLAFDAGSVGFAEAWMGAAAYAFQIYFDFSGYSDMAIGLGLMLGFVFPKNFDSPYLADSITDFWRRWHISLSTWLRDYLYIPLGGNRRGPWRTCFNLGVVMLLGGLWHGAAWNFVVWGGLHGVLLIGERACGGNSLYRTLARPWRVALTFALLCVTWVFFRAESLSHALMYLGSMLGFGTAQPGSDLLCGVMYQPYYLLSMLIAATITWSAPQTWTFTRTVTPARACVTIGVFWLSIVMLTVQSFNPFIYFIF